MSRRKKRRRKSPPAHNTANSQTTETANIPQPVGQETVASRRSFRIAALLFVLWVAGLITLVMFTANPVTLNRRQLRIARTVITGEVVDLANGRVKVIETWNGSETGAEIVVERLAENVRVAGWWNRDVLAGGTYLFALSGASNRKLHVTPAHPGEESALIYPANDSTKRQLRDLFPVR